jgi:hypothetical protein
MTYPHSRVRRQSATAILLSAALAALVVTIGLSMTVRGEDTPAAASGEEGTESSSEEWTPPPSEAWAPSEAWSPPANAAATPPARADGCANTPQLFDAPCFSDRGQTSSSFQPILGRYGLIAPRPSCDACGPMFDPRVQQGPYSSQDFTPDPSYYEQRPYDRCAEQSVYGGKYLNPVQRPLVEWGMPLYLNGPVPPPTLEFGPTNPSLKRLYVYGDYRAAATYNNTKGDDVGIVANRLNLDLDYWLTATERFHGSIGPFQDGNDFMRVEFGNGRTRFHDELDLFDADTDTLFFEGDAGAIVGGATGRYAPFDMPVTAGLIPLLFQNGVWMDDAILGVAATIPARNSPRLDWSNFDVTFFAGFDQLNSPAFGDDTSANVFGATTFIEAKGGYIEAGYAFLDDPNQANSDYNNVGLSYTRRYLNLVSNSMRLIYNVGQSGPESDRTADGILLLAENSFLTPWPYNVIPYVNAFAGFDRPESVARAGAAGGVLRNTGILFESDNLTGYPTLDASGNNTFGAAAGVDLLSPNFRDQLILETAVLQVMDDSASRIAPGDQYGVGARYQVPISNCSLIRFDVMHGWLNGADDVSGVRAEYRWKF